MKTKIFQIGVLAASLFSFCACNLDYAPENTLVDEKVYKTSGSGLGKTFTGEKARVLHTCA